MILLVVELVAGVDVGGGGVFDGESRLWLGWSLRVLVVSVLVLGLVLEQGVEEG